MKSTHVERATIAIPQQTLDDLRHRLESGRWPDRETVKDTSQGVPFLKLQSLVNYWRGEYDWRACERLLNGWNPFRTEVSGLGIHFLHIRSPEATATPVIMTHGWPGSILEFRKVIAPLTDPRAHGGDPNDAVHLVLPSLPGYGFSDKPADNDWTLRRIASAWIEIMHRLGYIEGWIAQGGDWGAEISAEIGRLKATGCVGIHLNNFPSVPMTGKPKNKKEAALLKRRSIYEHDLSGYNQQQRTRPQTLGYALADSPIGQAAWIYEKFNDWTDNTSGPESIFSMQEMVDNIMLYWLNNAGASSARRYWVHQHSHEEQQRGKIILPVAFTAFPGDIIGTPEHLAEARIQQLVSWREAERGGHFAAWEQPEIFVRELRLGLRAITAEID